MAITGTVKKAIDIKQSYKGSTFTGNVDDILRQIKEHSSPTGNESTFKP